MKTNLVSALGCALSLVAVFGLRAHGAVTLDLTSSGASSGTFKDNDAFFERGAPQPTGTGYIDPFLRIQQKGNESGYNTSGTPVPLDVDNSAGAHTHDLLLSSLAPVSKNGVTYYQFLVDINESASNPRRYTTLNSLQFFQTTIGSQVVPTDEPYGYKLGNLADSTLVWDMNSGQAVVGGNNIKLDATLANGSGSGDMYAYIPTALFDPSKGNYVVLYSHFGNPPGEFASDGGFEEWTAVVNGPVVPEPTTLVAAALLLLPFSASALRSLLRNGREARRLR